MKTGAGLALICIGAILAFAVTTNTAFFNLHTAGWVLMIIGLIGLLLPNRTYGWLGRRLLVRRTYPGGNVQHIPVPPYVARNPGISALENGLPSRPSLLDQEDDLIERTETGYDEVQESETPGHRPGTGGSGTGHARSEQRPRVATEVIEDLYEQP